MKLVLVRKNSWDRTSPKIKRYAGAVRGLLPGQYALGWRFRKVLKFAARAQWRSAGRARHYQTG